MISHDAAAFCGFYVSKADGTLDQKIFTTLNDYSQPRLVEYYDGYPCGIENQLRGMASGMSLSESVVAGYGVSKRKSLGVRTEAKYLVGEYDILILSAKESQGLKTWLTENGYKILAGAGEILEPYIRSNLANAEGDQDMIVYAFSKKGRVECANYRTVSLPTGKHVPLFVQQNFGNFYSNLFQHQLKMEGKAVTMLEYALDVSPQNYVKCDPCVASAPSPRICFSRRRPIWKTSRPAISLPPGSRGPQLPGRKKIPG